MHNADTRRQAFRAGLARQGSVIVAVAALACCQADALAQDDSVLGTASSFSVLAGSAVTNTGFSVIQGNLGVSPGTAVTGFPPGLVVDGTIHSADAVAAQAQIDLTTAYNALAGMAPTANLTGQDLGGLTLTPGVYKFDSSAQLTGALTLNALGNPDALFVFQIGSTLTTASASSVLETNGVDDCNVYWDIGSSATLGTTTAFQGNILAVTSITLTTGATIESGSALAQNGAVTLDDNTITATDCNSSVAPAVPEGSSAALFLGGGVPLLGAFAMRRRVRR
jgi:type VI secretion system secreted protein VgrG